MGRQIFSNEPGKGAALGKRTGNGLLWELGERQVVFPQGPNEQA
jgi:hypothetical protein